MKRYAIAVAMVAATAGAALANETRVYSDVSDATFQCVRETSAARQGTHYEATGVGSGTATTSSTLWTVVMDYVFAAETQSLRYGLVHKSWIVPADAVWAGIEAMITECRRGAERRSTSAMSTTFSVGRALPCHRSIDSVPATWIGSPSRASNFCPTGVSVARKAIAFSEIPASVVRPTRTWLPLTTSA